MVNIDYLLKIDGIDGESTFARIEYEYKEQKADGSLSGSIKVGWDVKAGKKL